MTTSKRKITLLGSTGSIGQSTLAICRHLSIPVKALAAKSRIDILKQQILEFHPEIVAVYDEHQAELLSREKLDVKIVSGRQGVIEVAGYPGANFAVCALVGLEGLDPAIAAIKSGKDIALATKEILVSAGKYITELAKQYKVNLLPVDSEHSAIFQLLEGRDKSEIAKVILTASGGPFRNYSEEDLQKITPEQALNHPTWKMGPKVTVDSSTLMNKGLEVIEAHFLFDIPHEKLEVIVHPQSIIHSFVECVDGTLFAQMHDPLMTYPIQYALTFPERKKSLYPPFDFIKNGKLEFFPPDFNKFRSLGCAFEALRVGKSLPCYLNAANEVLVERFLDHQISWKEMTVKLEKLLARHNPQHLNSVDSIMAVDREARLEAKN